MLLTLLFIAIVLLIIIKFLKFNIKCGKIIVSAAVKGAIAVLNIIILAIVIYGLWRIGSLIFGSIW